MPINVMERGSVEMAAMRQTQLVATTAVELTFDVITANVFFLITNVMEKIIV